jgi:hypothetical protein
MNRTNTARLVTFAPLLAAGVAALLGACGSENTGSGGSGGSGASGGATSSSVSSGGATSSSSSAASSSSSASSSSASSSSSSGTGGAPCAPGAACMAVDKDCIGLVDNAAQPSAGLRMSQLSLTKPSALNTGLVKNVVQGGVLPNIPTCNLGGSATFNWLLQFDIAGGTLKTGGAKPVADPSTGYLFVDEMVTQNGTQFHLQPVTMSATVGPNGDFNVATGVDLLVPIYLDAGGTQVVILPMHKVRFINGKLSADHNCIGQYNAQGLDPNNGCLGDAQTPTFLEDAQLDGFVTLEEADTVVVAALSQTLCVLLSGNSAMYGDGGVPIQKCKRTNGVIDFHGDWCAATDAAASANCFDALAVNAGFAASSIAINN